MVPGDDGLESLREAVRVSPDNLPLRQHLADTLLGRSRLDEAEAEYRKALTLAPQSVPLKLGLARAFYMQSKDGAAAVIVEELIKDRDPPAQAHLLHARLLSEL